MAYVRNALISSCKYLTSGNKGVFPTYSTMRKLFSAIPILESPSYANVLLQNSIRISSKRFSSSALTDEQKAKRLSYQETKMLNKFKHLKLEDLVRYPNYYNETALLALFHKMCVVYHLNKFDTKFILHLPNLLKTKEFITFGTLLEKYLTKLAPDILVFLLNLSLFRVPVDSPLMRKILTLILDNLNCISLCDILELYIQLNEDYFKNSVECNNVKKACEVYFEKAFENEISHCILYEDLIYFLQEESLPVFVRKMIAERVLEFLTSENLRPQLVQKFFHEIFKAPFFPSLKDRAMKVFKNNVEINLSSKVQSKLCTEYSIAVFNNNAYYDEEICEVLAKCVLTSKNHYSCAVVVLEKLCLMGYFHNELLQYTVDLLLALRLCIWEPQLVCNMASTLARTNFHEMNHPDLERVRERLLSYDDEKAFSNNFSSLLKWTESLTYLGCDTRNLLSKVFTIACEEDLLKNIRNWECCLLLQLHHLAKEYFPEGYTKLSGNILDIYLQKAACSKNSNLFAQIYDFFGGEDYIIQNCTTSQNYFIPFAVMLGSDNKPINLSSYKSAFKNTSGKDTNTGRNDLNLKIENISKPPGSKIITFIEYHDIQPIQYRNVPMTSGMARIFMKSYQNLQYDMVMLPLKMFKVRSEETEKYLRSQIDEIIKKPGVQTLKN